MAKDFKGKNQSGGVNTPNYQGTKGTNSKGMVLASRPSKKPEKDPMPGLAKAHVKVQKLKK